jgi:hypothetical protein
MFYSKPISKPSSLACFLLDKIRILIIDTIFTLIYSLTGE